MFKLANLTIKDVEDNGWLLYKVVTGSTAYGTNLPTSDIDIRGVFKLPTDLLLSGYVVEQVHDETNDTVYYELGRFIELLIKGNPNILEMLFIDEEHIQYIDPKFKDCFYGNTSYITGNYVNATFGYCHSQIKKARGVNKKFVNPEDGVRKSMLNFCYIITGDGETKPLLDMWLSKEKQTDESEVNKFLSDFANSFGVKSVPNGNGLYAVYPNMNDDIKMNGLLSDYNSTQFKLSSIPKDITVKPLIVWFNEDGFSVHCRKCREYNEWFENRNPDRYNHNYEVKYDSKNMMHCVRILMTLSVYLKTGVLKVKLDDIDTLMRIRKSEMEYDEVLSIADNLRKEIEENIGSVRDKTVDEENIRQIILSFRK